MTAAPGGSRCRFLGDIPRLGSSASTSCLCDERASMTTLNPHRLSDYARTTKTKKPPICFLSQIGGFMSIPLEEFLAEREGFEPTTLTAYISATSLSKFQIGNETVTIFRCWACPTLTAVCLPNFRVQRYGFLLKLANI